jgi:hemerythrin superfamily protein
MDINYYIAFDLPVPYKNIMIYPATVKDYMLFTTCTGCLSLDKNSIPDAKILTMTDLEYLFYCFQDEGKKEPYLLWFDRLLSICLRDDKSFENIEESMKRYKYDQKGKPFFTIGDETYTFKDFAELKKIICLQNLVELPDENISKEVRDSLEKAKDYKSRISGTKPASLEDYIISLSIVTGWTFDYIYTLSIRKFTKSLRRLDNYIHYKIYLSATMSGMAHFEDTSFIKHWLSDIEEEDKYGDVSVDLSSIQSKVSLESAKPKKE